MHSGSSWWHGLPNAEWGAVAQRERNRILEGILLVQIGKERLLPLLAFDETVSLNGRDHADSDR